MAGDGSTRSQDRGREPGRSEKRMRRSRCNLIETPLGEAPDISPQAVNFRDRRCYNPIILEKRVAPGVPLQISQAAPMILAWIIVEGIVITVGIVAVAVRIGIGMIMLLRSDLGADAERQHGHKCDDGLGHLQCPLGFDVSPRHHPIRRHRPRPTMMVRETNLTKAVHDPHRWRGPPAKISMLSAQT